MPNKVSPNMKFFKKQGEQIIFTGDKLEIFVPRRYQDLGYVWMSETVKTIGTFDMLINSTIESGLFATTVVEIIPDEINDANVNGEDYIKLTLNKGSVFLTSTVYKEYGDIAEILFGEYAMKGKYPKFIPYSETGFLWGLVGDMSGVRYSSSQSIFEMQAAFMARNPDKVSEQYRLAKTNKPPLYVGYFNIANLSETMSGRLNGAYAKEGLNACLANASDTISPMEDILRK